MKSEALKVAEWQAIFVTPALFERQRAIQCLINRVGEDA